ncbi:MAG: MFS transporter [Bdellovibrionota bacterium]
MLGSRFWFLRISESISILSTKISIMVATWCLIDMQNKAFVAAMALGGYYAFLILNGFAFSHYLDQKDKKLFILGSLLASIFASVGIFYCVYEGAFKSFFVLCLYFLSIASAIYGPIVNALIPSLMPSSKVEIAYAYSFSMQSACNILGIFSGAFLIDFFGVRAAQWVSVSLFFVGLFLVLWVDLSLEDQRELKNQFAMPYKEKISLFVKARFELWWSVLSFFANFFFIPLVMFVIPVYVSKELNEGSRWVAIFESSISVGMLLMATFFYKKIRKFVKNKMMILIASFAMVSVSLIGMSFFYSKLVWVVSLLLLGAAVIANNTTVESIRSVCIPTQHRGFFQTIHGVIIKMAIPAGMLFVGQMEKHLNVTSVLWLSAAAFAFLSFVLPKIPDIVFLMNTPIEKLTGIYRRLYGN